MTSRRSIAFVLPVYDEVEGVAAFHEVLARTVAARPDLDFEFVYVDDGSRDGSLGVLTGLREADDRVTVVSLSRNFGHQVAVTAGLDLVEGHDAVVVMDCDLQDPPRVSLEMIEMWERGVDVVYAVRRTRQDSAFKRATASAFYRTLSRLASIDIPRNVGDFRLMDRRVVAEVNRYREHNRFLRGVVADVGFRQEPVYFDRAGRETGRSHYPLRKMLKLAADGILGFSTVPLQLISRLGVLVSLLSAVAGSYVLFVRLFRPEAAVPGWAFLGVGLFFLGGLQMLMMGVIGSYLGRTFVEVRNRPLYSVAMVGRGAGLVGPAEGEPLRFGVATNG